MGEIRAEFLTKYIRSGIMQLKGSCHCRKITFSVCAYAPTPYMRCYCSICRKTAGTGGYAINIGAHSDTLKITGKKYLSFYRPIIREKGKRAVRSKGERYFCSECGSALWTSHPDWPDHVYPYASAIDTKLPIPPSIDHILLDSKANWVTPCLHKGDRQLKQYPEDSLEDWHKRHKKLLK